MTYWATSQTNRDDESWLRAMRSACFERGRCAREVCGHSSFAIAGRTISGQLGIEWFEWNSRSLITIPINSSLLFWTTWVITHTRSNSDRRRCCLLLPEFSERFQLLIALLGSSKIIFTSVRLFCKSLVKPRWMSLVSKNTSSANQERSIESTVSSISSRGEWQQRWDSILHCTDI